MFLSRQRLRWPASFTQASNPPVIDYTCRVKQDAMGWQEDLCPLLFAAQFVVLEEERAIEQLAKAFQPMMTLFILYYLDFRTSRRQRLPSWMVLYGAVYDNSGLSIRAHYPCFDPPQMGSKPSGGRGWGSVSRKMGNDYRNLIFSDPTERGSFFATLNRIQGHCAYVLEMLQKWDSYKEAISKVLQI